MKRSRTRIEGVGGWSVFVAVCSVIGRKKKTKAEGAVVGMFVWEGSVYWSALNLSSFWLSCAFAIVLDPGLELRDESRSTL